MDSLLGQLTLCNYSSGRELAAVAEHGSFSQRAAPSSPLLLLVTVGWGWAPHCPPWQGEGHTLWHLPSPPALPASFGGSLVLPEFVPSPESFRGAGQQCWGSQTWQRGRADVAHITVGGSGTPGHSVSPPFAPPAPCGCWGPPVPGLPERVLSQGAIIPE